MQSGNDIIFEWTFHFMFFSLFFFHVSFYIYKYVLISISEVIFGVEIYHFRVFFHFLYRRYTPHNSSKEFIYILIYLFINKFLSVDDTCSMFVFRRVMMFFFGSDTFSTTKNTLFLWFEIETSDTWFVLRIKVPRETKLCLLPPKILYLGPSNQKPYKKPSFRPIDFMYLWDS